MPKASQGCSVTLASQDPRPANGYVNVLAYAVGEASADTSGNNVYAQGMAFEDLGDVFLDTNESTSGIRASSSSRSPAPRQPGLSGLRLGLPVGLDRDGALQGNTCNGTWGRPSFAPTSVSCSLDRPPGSALVSWSSTCLTNVDQASPR